MARRAKDRAERAASFLRRRGTRLTVLCVAMAILSFYLAWGAGKFLFIYSVNLASVRNFVFDRAWLLPLFAGASIWLLTTSRARGLLPKRRHRIVVGILLTAAIFGLSVLNVRTSLLTLGLAVGASLLLVWIFVVPQRIAPPLSTAELDKLGTPRDALELKDARTKLQNEYPLHCATDACRIGRDCWRAACLSTTEG